MKKLLKMIGLTIVGIILIIVIGGALFLNLSPQFGGKHTKEDLKRYQASGHYENGKFENLITTPMDMSFSNIKEMLQQFMKGNPKRKPDFQLPVNTIDSLELEKNKSTDRLIWFGHSAFLLQLDNKNILIDPMFGESPSPHPWLGTNRFSSKLPINIKKLPKIDAIIISHDHYDHLDYGSIQQLKDKVGKYYVPLGVGSHLEAWGINPSDIEELNWWDKTKHENIELVFTPSRHFSGRGLGDRFSTMWGSWVIKTVNKNIYFSGDSGYGPHFKEIGVKYGPFDFAMMECGQYDEKWSTIHMMPEETAQAAVEVNTKIMMPIHWGAFSLAFHDWNDPIKRVVKKAEELNVPITVPEIGQEIALDSISQNKNKWWKN